MLALHKQLHATKKDRDKELLQRQIDATDRKIDELVYKLYGLTTELCSARRALGARFAAAERQQSVSLRSLAGKEIRIVEEATDCSRRP